MKTALTLTVAEGHKVAAAFIEAARDNGWDDDDINTDLIAEYAHALDKAMEAIGVEFVIDPNLTEEEEEEEETTGEDEMESIVRIVDGRRGWSAEDVKLLIECVSKVMHDKYEGLPESIIMQMVELEACRIADAYGIEVVDE